MFWFFNFIDNWSVQDKWSSLMSFVSTSIDLFSVILNHIYNNPGACSILWSRKIFFCWFWKWKVVTFRPQCKLTFALQFDFDMWLNFSVVTGKPQWAKSCSKVSCHNIRTMLRVLSSNAVTADFEHVFPTGIFPFYWY